MGYPEVPLWELRVYEENIGAFRARLDGSFREGTAAVGAPPKPDGYSALHTRAQSLFRDLAMARADGSLRSLVVRVSRIDVLAIDDWSMAPPSETGLNLLSSSRGLAKETP